MKTFTAIVLVLCCAAPALGNPPLGFAPRFTRSNVIVQQAPAVEEYGGCCGNGGGVTFAPQAAYSYQSFRSFAAPAFVPSYGVGGVAFAPSYGIGYAPRGVAFAPRAVAFAPSYGYATFAPRAFAPAFTAGVAFAPSFAVAPARGRFVVRGRFR